MNQNGTVSAMRKLKSASAVSLLILVSMMAMLASMPYALAANEKISGKVTLVGAGTPMKDVQVMVFNEQTGFFAFTQTNVTGNYSVNLPGAGKYIVMILNGSYSGFRTEATVTTGLNYILNYAIQPDTTTPTISDYSMTVTNGISKINPSDILFTIEEKWLSIGKVDIFQITSVTGDKVNISLVKEYTNFPFFENPGRPMEQYAFTSNPPGTNSTSLQFNGTAMSAWLSDGTDAWRVPYGKPTWTSAGNVDFVYCYYENNSNKNNKDGWYMEFDSATHALKQIDSYNDSLGQFVQDAVDLSDVTGKVMIRNELGNFNLTSGMKNADSIPVTPFILVKDLEPLLIDNTLPSGQYIVTFNAQDFGNNEQSKWAQVSVDNHPPVASPGANVTIKQGEIVELNGTDSTDDMGIVNYTWDLWVAGNNYELYDAITTTPTLNSIGVWQVNLTVTDAGTWYDTAITFINVTDGVAPEPDAGKNVTAMQDHAFKLNGSLTRDNFDVLTDLNYTWSFNDTVKNVTLYGIMPTYTLSKMGTYKVALVVTDKNGNVAAPAYTWIIITDGIAPDANAGTDISVKQNRAFAFNGSGCSDNVGIANYTWNFTDKGAPVKLYGKAPTYTFDAIGAYNVTLTVKDAAGLTDTDTVLVTVVDGISPVANAGQDQMDEVGVVLTFNGSGSTDNVGVATYNWTFGDGNWSIGKIVQHAYAKVQKYTVTLTCIDAQGNSATDTMNVTVLPKNHAPVIAAIPDQKAYQGTQFSLSLMPAYVSEQDLTDILAFSISALPAGIAINNNTGAITWTPATNQVGIAYKVTITVSDGKATVSRAFNITAYPKTLHVKIGPIKDNNGAVVKDALVTVMSGIDTNSNKTDTKGIASVDVPGQWAGRTVTVKVHKAGYTDATIDGTIGNDGTFTPANGYTKLKGKQSEDYAFVIIAIIVLLILALALFSLKGPSGDKEEEEEEEKGEESLTEEE